MRPLAPTLREYDTERADFQRVLAAMERIRTAALEQLRDFAWLHEVVCSVGVSMLPDLEATYGEFAGLARPSHQGISQYPSEFTHWLLLLGEHQIRSYLEIGAFNGNTASLAAAYLARFVPDLHALTIDLFPSFFFHHLVRDLVPLEYRVGTSYALQAQTFDAVFIDGDHTFDWTWADFDNVGRRARVCGLHDIRSRHYFETMEYGAVVGTWELLQRDHGGPGVKFLEFCEHPAGDRFGIGARVVGESFTATPSF